MKFCHRYFWIALLLIFSSTLLEGQTISFKKSTLLEATSQNNPPAIYLSWNLDFEADNYTLYKREFGESEWQLIAESIAPGQVSYTDVFVSEGKLYEYKIEKENVFGLNSDYILSSPGYQKDFYEGKLLCLVEEDLYSLIEPELENYEEDMRHSGWSIEIITISTASSVSEVKELIQNSWIDHLQ